MEEKTKIFATLLSDLVMLVTCINAPQGSHHKCTCLHMLCNDALCWLVARWCATFTNQMQTMQNKVLVDWYCYAHQSNPTYDKKKKIFLIPYKWNESDVACVELCQDATISTSIILLIWRVGNTWWENIIQTQSVVVKSNCNINNKDASIKPELSITFTSPLIDWGKWPMSQPTITSGKWLERSHYVTTMTRRCTFLLESPRGEHINNIIMN